MLDNDDIIITNFFEGVEEISTDEKDIHKCSFCNRYLYMSKRRPTMNSIQNESEERIS